VNGEPRNDALSDPRLAHVGEPAVEQERRIDYSDPNVTIDAHEDTWAWRRRIRSNPRSLAVYRVVVGVVGAAVTIVGIIAVPAPGPGWLIVFLGLTILASEFEFAQRLLHFARRHVTRWNDWVMGQAIWVRALAVLVTLTFVWAMMWAYLAWQGIPEWVPGWAEGALVQVPGID
jgi:uncharacterized protein (TIGR02611 family)